LLPRAGAQTVDAGQCQQPGLRWRLSFQAKPVSARKYPKAKINCDRGQAARSACNQKEPHRTRTRRLDGTREQVDVDRGSAGHNAVAKLRHDECAAIASNPASTQTPRIKNAYARGARPRTGWQTFPRPMMPPTDHRRSKHPVDGAVLFRCCHREEHSESEESLTSTQNG